MTVVRPYEHDRDFDAIARLGLAHVAETSPHLAFDLDVLRTNLGAQEHRSDKLTLVAMSGKVMVGYLLATAEAWVCNNDRYTVMDQIYVAAEYRGSRALLELVYHYLLWAKDIGANPAFAGVNHGGESVDGISNLFSRMGFTPCGVLLWRDCNAVS